MKQGRWRQGFKGMLLAVSVLAVLGVGPAGPAAQGAGKPPSANPWAGKIIWVVDVNSNEDYNSLLLEEVTKLLPRYARGAKAKRVKTGDKNPFFLLRQEDTPAAAVVGAGVCEATTPQAVNYAASALKLGIPSVVLHITAMKASRERQAQAHRIPDLRFVEVANGAPSEAKEAASLAKEAAPALVKALAEQMKN